MPDSPPTPPESPVAPATSRARAIVALLLAAVAYLATRAWHSHWSTKLLEEWGSSSEPPPPHWWWSDAGLNAARLVSMAVLASSLLLLLRGVAGWKTTVRRWFLGRGLRGAALGVALALPLLPVLILMGGGFSPETLPAEAMDFWLPFSLAAVLVAPFSEEVVFRGFLFSTLATEVRLRPWMALAVSSLLFGAAHLTSRTMFSWDGLEKVADTGAFGAFACWAFWRRGEDLGFPIGFHMGSNLCGSVFVLLGSHDDDRMQWGLPTSAALSLALAFIVLIAMEKRKARAALAPSPAPGP